jgi:hypothetical protein
MEAKPLGCGPETRVIAWRIVAQERNGLFLQVQGAVLVGGVSAIAKVARLALSGRFK